MSHTGHEEHFELPIDKRQRPTLCTPASSLEFRYPVIEA